MVFAEQEKSKGSLHKVAAQFRRQRARSLQRECIVQLRHHAFQKQQARQIIRCFKTYSQIRLLGLAFQEMRAICRDQRESTLRLEQAALMVAQRTNGRLKSKVFSWMLAFARKQ